MQTPTIAVKGDEIVHELMPGFVMAVEDVEACETDGTRNEPHLMYQVTDPEGNTDWLCSWDVKKVSG